ncbi:hypothetical protein [Achromobacter phage Motura]|uniref:Uncharacterized protein n=1 Tax=Achromobacter phage Motura TaxID=2591403 RepID=A0A514CT96_9CAUD|nr:hypothetical protein H1O15_gp109 [Achromobacter phage Motura]QDH83718.1 hypothetical protein [Achromobacter phage Motura]
MYDSFLKRIWLGIADKEHYDESMIPNLQEYLEAKLQEALDWEYSYIKDFYVKCEIKTALYVTIGLQFYKEAHITFLDASGYRDLQMLPANCSITRQGMQCPAT